MKRTLFTISFLFSIVFANAQNPDLAWVKQIGNSSGDAIILSSATDADGNLYSTGVITGTVDLDPGPNTAWLTDAGFGDLFISKTDPTGNFAWAKRIGKDSYDQGSSVALDAAGNIYIAGFFSMDSTDFDPGPGTFYLTNAGGANSFILKLDAAGNFIWAKKMGPAGNSPHSITLDASGNILVSGVFGGTVDFDPGPNNTSLTAISNDIYILKLNAAGNFVWAKQVDVGITNTRSYSIATDAGGDVYVTGLLFGTVDIDPGSGISNLTASSSFGAEYILKLDASGIYVWAKVINGSISQTGGDRAIRVDAAGNSYTAGWFGNTVDFDPNGGVFNLANTTTTGGSTYLLKLDASGNLAWAGQIGDPGNGDHKAIALDASGNFYVAGTIGTPGDFDPGAGILTLSPVGGSSFVAKYDVSGNIVWAVNFSNDTVASSHSCTVSLDAAGNVYTTGVFKGTGDFDPGAGIFNLTANNLEDVFIHKMDGNATTSAYQLASAENNWSIYPNPSNGSFYLKTNGAGSYTILNEMGQVVKIFSADGKEVISISGLGTGVYFVVGKNEGKKESRRVVVR